MALAAVLMLSLALRLLRLGWHDAWADEGFSIWLAGLDRADMLAVLARDAHPPLFYVLLKGWLAVVGADANDFVARLPFALAGVGTTWATWWMARPLLGRAALAAAALQAASQSASMLDQEIRMYALLALFATVAGGFLARLDRAPRAALGYALALILAFYTHYLAVFAFMGHAAWALLAAPAEARRRWIPAAAAACVAFAPWALTMGIAQIRAGAGPPHAPPGFADLPWAVYALLAGLGAPLFTAASWPAAALDAAFAAPPLYAWLRRPRALALPALAAFVPLTATWAASLPGHVHFFTPKYFTFVLPPLWILIAGAPRRVAVAAAILALGLNVRALVYWDAEAAYQKARWRDAVAALRADYRPDDAVVVMNSFQSYVLDRALRQSFGSTAPQPVYVSSWELKEEPLPRRVLEAAQTHRRLWIVLCDAHQVDPQDTLVRRLHARGRWLGEAAFPLAAQPDAGVVLLLWESGNHPATNR